MNIYIAVDTSLSMRLPMRGKISRYSVACQLAVKTIQNIREMDLKRTIKLVNFSHNSRIISHKIESAEDAGFILNGLAVSASADLISLFLLIKKESSDGRSTLLVFTDACAFTPEEINLEHLPNCAVRFACILKDSLVNEHQIARLWAISLHTSCMKEDLIHKKSELWMPYFLSDYDDISECAWTIAKCLCPSPYFLLRCGMLRTPFKVIPTTVDNDWNFNIEIIGFTSVNDLAIMPTFRHCFVISHNGSEDVLNMLCSALRADGYVALCRMNKYMYGALSSFSGKDDPTNFRLSIEVFPPGPESVFWLPSFITVISKGTVGPKEEPLLCVEDDGLSRPSYSSLQRSCWFENHGLQSDIQKLVRLLKKIPDKMLIFYSELNRFYGYCCAVGAEDVLEKLIQIIHEEGISAPTPTIKKHSAHIIEKLRKSGMKYSTEIQPLQ